MRTADEARSEDLDRILNALTELLETWRHEASTATTNRLKAEIAGRPWDAERLGAQSDMLKACATRLEAAIGDPNLGRA